MNSNNFNLDYFLQKCNHKYLIDEVPHNTRYKLAFDEYRKLNNHANFSELEDIYKWFQINVNPYATKVGNILTASFYFDLYFWKMNINIMLGSPTINKKSILNSLSDMPPATKNLMCKDEKKLNELILYYIDCLEVFNNSGSQDIKPNISDYGIKFFRSGLNNIFSVHNQILFAKYGYNQAVDNTIMEHIRMGIEKILKAFCIVEKKLTPSASDKKFLTSKSMGHNLSGIVDICYECTNDNDFLLIKKHINLLPKDVNHRYENINYADAYLWRVIKLMHFIANKFLRNYYNTNFREQILKSMEIDNETAFDILIGN